MALYPPQSVPHCLSLLIPSTLLTSTLYTVAKLVLLLASVLADSSVWNSRPQTAIELPLSIIYFPIEISGSHNGLPRPPFLAKVISFLKNPLAH